MRRAPSFWWQDKPTLAARMLAPVGMIYDRTTRARMDRPPAFRAPCPVICVGNPVAGGAGKTPVARAVGALVRERGRAPVFLSRGYGGTQDGPLVVDAQKGRAQEVGDEPLLLASDGPTVVARDRAAGAALAATLGDVIIMDDGFQNPVVEKTLSLLVIDTDVGIGNGLCVPAGPLRAAFGFQVCRADAVIALGGASLSRALADEVRALVVPILPAVLVPDAAVLAKLRAQPVIAFAGIGRPEKFFKTLRASGITIAQTVSFPDHHAYSARDASRLHALALNIGAQLVTTQKDAQNMEALDPLFLDNVSVLPVRLEWSDPEALSVLLDRALS